MKLISLPANPRRQQRGSAVVVVLAMLGIMMIFVSINTITINRLGQELKLLEKKQVQRIQPAAKNPSGHQIQNPQSHD